MEAGAIQLRWMNLSDLSRPLLSDMARGFVAIYDRIPPFYIAP